MGFSLYQKFSLANAAIFLKQSTEITHEVAFSANFVTLQSEPVHAYVLWRIIPWRTDTWLITMVSFRPLSVGLGLPPRFSVLRAFLRRNRILQVVVPVVRGLSVLKDLDELDEFRQTWPSNLQTWPIRVEIRQKTIGAKHIRSLKLLLLKMLDHKQLWRITSYHISFISLLFQIFPSLCHQPW